MDTSLRKKYNIHFYGKEAGETLLFANGYGCDLSMWRYIVPDFQTDYRLVLFDYVGLGKSDISQYSRERYSSLGAYAEDLIEIAKGIDSRPLHLVAHSVSAMIGAIAAIREPELFTDIIMIGPSACYINSPDGSYFGGFAREDIDALMDSLENNYLGWATSITPVIMGNPDKPHLTQELTNIFCRNNPDVAKQFARVTFLSDNRSDLPRIPVPCYIIQSKVDSIASVEVGKYVAENIPKSEFCIIDSHGHCPHLSHPAEVSAILKNILASSPE